MCGIIAVLAHRSTRAAPELAMVLEEIDSARLDLAAILEDGPTAVGAAQRSDRLGAAARRLEAVRDLLKGPPGAACLIGDGALVGADLVSEHSAPVQDALAQIEAVLDDGAFAVVPAELEKLNSTLLRVKDALWSIRRDRVEMARTIASLLPISEPQEVPRLPALEALWAVQVALGSLDRLEVRGRDSAGLHLLVSGHGLDFEDPGIAEILERRCADVLFTSMAVRTPSGHLSFVYKAAAEIGELGDNTRALRAALRSDVLLARALGSPTARCTVLGHTRWASVGVISEPNAHPLNSDEVDHDDGPYVTAALNGDVDNYLDLRLSEALQLPAEVSTDAKVIPTLISRRLSDGVSPFDAFRETVGRFHGSVAVAASTADEPDRLYLALRGSGQSINIGLAEDAFVVASEAYGVVEETARYLRMDGETSQGQIVVLDRASAGSLVGIERRRYDGQVLPVDPGEVQVAEITTRDIDRRGAAHFLLKEISEAPQSFRKTLRGKISTGDDGLSTARIGDETIPPDLARCLSDGRIRRVLFIGQGTAAVAGQAGARALAGFLHKDSHGLNTDRVEVSALPATELSGFGLSDDMSDTLVVAMSQSGTTTDTNRTVDLVRGRQAHVIAVVNRRNSDLVEKADGVLYTSDGRDVEMSVASTKAFYSQVAAGFLLALALAGLIGTVDTKSADELLQALRHLPDDMDHVLAERDAIAAAASVVLSRRYWAVVGSGPDRVAAAEIRIKLSELCYKAIACDATEDKKHIDLSSEPFILVCAAGLSGSNADDVAKEIAIYRAHKAAPVVIAAEGEAGRFSAAVHTIEVPKVHPALGFVLSAMVGHLFGYEAALAIDAQARPLRQARAVVDGAVSALVAAAEGRTSPGRVIDGHTVLAAIGPALSAATVSFFSGLRQGAYNGTLEAATAVRLVSLLRYADGTLPIESYELEYGKVGSPAAVIEDLLDALTLGIGELTRPIDAIKHQAKTVTVGISRREDTLLASALVKETLGAGASLDRLSYRALRTLSALDVAVARCLGYTRYRIDRAGTAQTVAAGATISVVDTGGLGARLASRTDTDSRLRGTKHRAADEREVTVARGRSDGRTVILVPETKANQVTGMTLLHVDLEGHLGLPEVLRVLSGYRNRLAAISDAVTETEPVFDEQPLVKIPLVELLTEPVYVLADRWWRSSPTGPSR